MPLIIVESPTKARTFNKILDGKDYFVFATMGHIRDLPGNKISIDYKNDFKPNYIAIKKKVEIVAELKKLAKSKGEIILATDPDREGESISYHVAYLLGLIKENWPDFTLVKNVKLKRIVFHEITAEALKEALAKPQELRVNLVKAQQARRLLDRIVGYELSPLLWKKMGKNWLSAGRVQTVALRLIVEREKEILKFKSEEYYQVFGMFEDVEKIKAKLVDKNGISFDQKFTLKLFASDYTYSKTTITKENVEAIKTDILSDSYKVDAVKESVQSRFPPPPFTTSLLQQESFQRFGYSSKMTMRLAQNLYEVGLITYHRTDSFNLASHFVASCQKYIATAFGNNYLLVSPRLFKTKSKLAQEAHEAIRPTNLKTGGMISEDSTLTQSHKKLYKLIFDRAVATQMKEASIKNIKITILGHKGYKFESDFQRVIFDGFLKLLNPGFIEQNQQVHNIKAEEQIKLLETELMASLTKPPPRYNEASIIKILEEKGIGRPSTYAPIISLIQEKNYVEKEIKSFKPTRLGEMISDYLSAAFPQLFDLNFTAQMEENLDKVAEGQQEIIALLKNFNEPFQKLLKIKKDDKAVIDVEESIDEMCPNCGSKLVIRYSKFGRFIACSGFPKCKFTKPFLQVVPDKLCPQDKGRIVVRFTKSKKKFFGCENYPKCQFRSWKLNF